MLCFCYWHVLNLILIDFILESKLLIRNRFFLITGIRIFGYNWIGHRSKHRNHHSANANKKLKREFIPQIWCCLNHWFSLDIYSQIDNILYIMAPTSTFLHTQQALLWCVVVRNGQKMLLQSFTRLECTSEWGVRVLHESFPNNQ